MTMESGQHRTQPASAVDLVPTMAESSAELWHDILERLREIQESQVMLAEAIEGLGIIVQHAPLPPVLPRAPQEPEPDASKMGSGFKTSAGPADSLITNVKASTQREWSGAAEVQEPLAATEVPEPVFYVPPFEEEVLPATSVVELTPDALDALLASEFGPGPVPQQSAATSAGAVTMTQPEASVGPAHFDTRQPQQAEPESAVPDTGPARDVPTIDPTNILDILLGTPRTTAETPPHTDAPATPSATNATAPPPPPLASPALSAEPPLPPPPPPPAFSEAPLPSSVFTAEPDVPAQPVLATEISPPLPPPPPPVYSEALPPPPPPPVFSEAPAPSSVFRAEPDASPSSQPPPPIPPPPPTGVLVEETTSMVNGIEPPMAFGDAAAEEDVATGTPQFTSTASMAAEVLSVSPEIPILEVPGTSESELISKDLTLIARERKKRFRLR